MLDNRILRKKPSDSRWYVRTSNLRWSSRQRKRRCRWWRWRGSTCLRASSSAPCARAWAAWARAASADRSTERSRTCRPRQYLNSDVNVHLLYALNTRTRVFYFLYHNIIMQHRIIDGLFDTCTVCSSERRGQSLPRNSQTFTYMYIVHVHVDHVAE